MKVLLLYSTSINGYSDKVVELAEGFKVVATSDSCPIAAAENVEKTSTASISPRIFVTQDLDTTYKNFIKTYVNVLITGLSKETLSI